MTSREFCYWLQGYFEIVEAGSSQTHPISFAQTDMIKKHLALVFKHEIDPSYPNQDELNKIHNVQIGGNDGDVVLRC